MRPMARAGQSIVIVAAGLLVGLLAARAGPPPPPVEAAAWRSSLQATTITFPAEADARVEEAYPTTNRGRSITLVADAEVNARVESYLRFTVSATSGAVQSATLRLFVSATGTTRATVETYPADNSWSETGITWTNRPVRATTAVDSRGPLAASAWVEFDVTALVAGNGTYTIVLATTSTDGAIFHAREATSNPPQLVLTTAGVGSPSPTPTPTRTPTATATARPTATATATSPPSAAATQPPPNPARR